MDPVYAYPMFAGTLLAMGALHFALGRRWRGRASKLVAEIAGPDDVVVERDGHFEVRTAGPGLAVHLRPLEIHRKGKEGGWHIEAPALRLATFTSLSLAFEGYAGGYRNKLGLLDIQVGDDAFDARFAIRGSHPDVVRAALASPQLRSAILRLFEGSLGVRRFDVGDDGLCVVVNSLDLDPATGRALLAQVQEIAVLLDAGIPADAAIRDVKQLEERGGDVVGVASDTGVPVVVRR